MKECRIRIALRLNSYLEGWFEDCFIETSGDETVITRKVADQAELYGILQRIHSLGIPLIEASIENKESGGEK